MWCTWLSPWRINEQAICCVDGNKGDAHTDTVMPIIHEKCCDAGKYQHGKIDRGEYTHIDTDKGNNNTNGDGGKVSVINAF